MPMGTLAGRQTARRGGSLKVSRSMNHKRISEISAEMSTLADQQIALMNDTSGSLTRPMTPPGIAGYAERNERLRELCRELNKLA